LAEAGAGNRKGLMLDQMNWKGQGLRRPGGLWQGHGQGQGTGRD
jgi:hypothetical protein